ncbi:MAG: exo-alpha-sialidase [Chitinispirillaceae bacterium]|nr:exo-alpha-sialidase [Chitinispirillaceae bacterium]
MPYFFLFVALTAVMYGTVCAGTAPFTVKAGLFDQSKPDDLGLTAADGTETVTIFHPSDATDHYSNGVVMIGFKGWLYCMWQSSDDSEDSPDTWVACSRSQDGRTWTAPMTLVPVWDQGYRSSGGWWVNGDTLVAYVNVWPSSASPRGGHTEYTTSTDGLNWSALKDLPMADGNRLNGIFEQDPHALPGGRIIGAAHFQPGLLVDPVYTDDPSGVRGWTRANLPNLGYSGTTTREMEPSWFYRADGAAVMVFRDQNSTFRRLASISLDRGVTWSTPVVTDMPDSRSKQSAGNLPDGTAFLVGNPVDTKIRIPLAVALSRYGQVFDKAFVLRKGGSDLQAQRYTGTSKTLGYSYPKSMIWQGYLYVSYSTNKEDVECTRVPVINLALNSAGSQLIPKSEPATVKVIARSNRIQRICLQGHAGDGTVSIVSLTGMSIFQGKMQKGACVVALECHAVNAYIITIKTDTGRTIYRFGVQFR